jgi:hypothetical protein
MIIIIKVAIDLAIKLFQISNTRAILMVLAAGL